MYENGVLAYVDVSFLADVHIRAFEDQSTSGRYFCFSQIVNTQEEAVKLAQSLSPLMSLPTRYDSIIKLVTRGKEKVNYNSLSLI